jgi:hypothetical protein
MKKKDTPPVAVTPGKKQTKNVSDNPATGEEKDFLIKVDGKFRKKSGS